MSESISLRTIYDLLGLNFYIPCYQRGYRWTEQQVKDLLNDIFDFTNKTKADGEFYCLQPIVIKPCDEEMVKQHSLHSELNDNKWYEVIDGQQRLTTIRIILSYLETCLGCGATIASEYGREKFVIEYETRRKTRAFLDQITKAYENVDCENIYNAYATVEKWFSGKTQQKPVRDKILNALLDQGNKNPVQVIWYELPSHNSGGDNSRSDAIDSFTRLNVGKIPLTNAELVKALFLQNRNFKEADVELRQIEIAKEWDQMENALQREEFWALLNDSKNERPVRIEFLFDTMYQAERKENAETDKYGTDQYATFRYFSKRITDASGYEAVLTIWQEVKDLFATFQDWYEDKIWYHYIGYLIWEGSSSILDIYEDYKKSNKSQFIESLKKRLKGSLEKINYSEENGEYLLNNNYDNTDKRTLCALFLLYNIEFIIQKNADYYRFPFDLFKKEDWDIEHISSQTNNSLSDQKSQKLWLDTALQALQEKERKEYEESHINGKSFEEKRKWIVTKVGEDVIDEELKNSIGNLTLLNASINRSYGNNIFPAKRNAIVERDKDGAFIPICTKNVFLKYHTGGNNLRWSEQDIRNSMSHIVEILKNYITKK